MDHEIRDINGHVIFRADLDTQPEPAAECAKAAVKLARNRAVSLARADLAFADLAGANLSCINLRNANLKGTNLCRADLRYADLRDANLCGANLCRADLRYADLRGVDLRNANLEGANLFRADLRGVDLRDANLEGANLCRADLRNANLDGSNLDGAKLDGAKTRNKTPRKPGYLEQLMPGPIVTLRIYDAPGGKLTLELPPRNSLIVGPLAVHPAIWDWRENFCDDTIDGEVFFCSAHHVHWSNNPEGYQVSHLKSGFKVKGEMRKTDAIALAHHLTKPGNGLDWDVIDPDNPTPEHEAMLKKVGSALIEWREANGL